MTALREVRDGCRSAVQATPPWASSPRGRPESLGCRPESLGRRRPPVRVGCSSHASGDQLRSPSGFQFRQEVSRRTGPRLGSCTVATAVTSFPQHRSRQRLVLGQEHILRVLETASTAVPRARTDFSLFRELVLENGTHEGLLAGSRWSMRLWIGGLGVRAPTLSVDIT